MAAGESLLVSSSDRLGAVSGRHEIPVLIGHTVTASTIVAVRVWVILLSIWRMVARLRSVRA